MHWHLLFQTTKKLRYRFGVILDELNKEESISYRAALLGFINCLIIYSKDIEDRVRIRNEFIGKCASFRISLSLSPWFHIVML